MSGREGSVEVRRAGPVAQLVWSRPPLNVFDIDLLGKVTDALGAAPVRTAAAVLLRGAQGRWSAGLAVEDHLGPSLDRMLSAFRRLLTTIWELPVPTMAVVEGPCLGGGLELLLPCDLAIAAATATFGQPEIRLGVLPPAAVAALGREVGPKAAAELLFSGETYPAAAAERLGLVGRVVPPAEIETEVGRAIERFGQMRPEALVLLKRAFRASLPFPWSEVGAAESIYRAELMRLPAAEEGLRAFLEKRPPHWPKRTGAPVP